MADNTYDCCSGCMILTNTTTEPFNTSIKKWPRHNCMNNIIPIISIHYSHFPVSHFFRFSFTWCVHKCGRTNVCVFVCVCVELNGINHDMENAFGTQPRYLLTSLALNDFAIGIFITPLGILPALFHCWPYGEIFCQIQVIDK